jgi:transitional endoplasmic reticulum ATPase
MPDIDDPENPGEIFIGTPGRVVAVEDGGRTFHMQLRNGGSARASHQDPLDVEAGASILVNEEGWRVVPPAALARDSSVGVVRKVSDEGIVLETNQGIQLIANTAEEGLGLAPGNTVEFDANAGVRRVISESPIRLRDVGVDGDDLSAYLVDTSGDTELTFGSFGGYEEVVVRAQELIETQLNRSAEMKEIGAKPVKGVIFTGPPGTGKTHLARIIAGVSGAKFYLVSGPQIVSKWVGDSEETLRRLFDAAERQDRAIIFFDEIDSIAARRSSDSNGESKRVVAQLLTLLDGFEAASNVVVIAATNRVEDIDEALLRPGRFDWEIQFGMPTVSDRYKILQVKASRLQTIEPLPLEELAALTEGWSGAMLTAIWTEAALLAASAGRKAIGDEDLAVAYHRVHNRPVRTRAQEVQSVA